MTQILMLLGLICNVILWLAIGYTNPIFSTVTLLIKCAMSVHTKQDIQYHIREAFESLEKRRALLLKEHPRIASSASGIVTSTRDPVTLITSPLPPRSKRFLGVNHSLKGLLYGHYSNNSQLYTVHSGSPDIVLCTPTPEEASGIVRTANIPIPHFRQPRYLSMEYAYMLFIPKHYAWRHELFEALDYPRHKLPIISDKDEGFCLHPDLADPWLNLEACLRSLGRAMIDVAPQPWLRTAIHPWFFPDRFKFMHKYRTEGAARYAAWRSIQNFLPLLGYVSMAFWCMGCWEARERDAGLERPDWRLAVTERTQIHPTFLDSLEKSIAANWNAERVGALYQIQGPADGDVYARYKEHEACEELETLLSTILYSRFPIPLYISWGKLPLELSPLDVPRAFHGLIPPKEDQEYLGSPQSPTKFSGWAVNDESLVWYRDPQPQVSLPNPVSPNKESPAVAAAPFPPLPPHSQQKPNETIQAFFIRRREANNKTIARETPADRQRRMQRTDNAKWGEVPSKASIFYWEEEDGHYIHLPGGRRNYPDLWREYPGPQRRFDPIFNQWDLCELFEKNDPVFGESYAEGPPSEDEDNDFGMHPTFPQNIDMASQLPREGNNFHTQVTEEQYPDDLEMASLEEDVPTDEDLGPDFTEFEVPYRNLAEASRKCVNWGSLKFGLAPRTERPEYESVAGNLLGALEKRFGFAMPPSPETFIARDPPEKSFPLQDLPLVVGMRDTIGCLAERPTACIRDLFRTVGIGSEVLLLPQATDVVEILHQQWGPDIRDIAAHLVARGTPFWLAYMSTQIMPAANPVQSGLRPKGFKGDSPLGLGFRPCGYAFDELDYDASEVTDEDFFCGFDDGIYDVGDCLWDGTSPHAYWYDRLSDHEIDLLCGVYQVGTGQTQVVGKGKGKAGKGKSGEDQEDITETGQTSLISWCPKPKTSWPHRAYILKNQAAWRHNLKFRKEVKRCWDGYERVADSIVQGLLASVVQNSS
ncbi:hypothetical protein K438DRAFT_1774710 [Mycena galopus ATCC 62051]|nr:hypothetical protein K438DRAFT_1774710 [Mycena galopus ATCC 62051]